MNTNVVLGFTCDIAWLFAYIAIIWRGFKERSSGMPMLALSTNISWEAIYSFFYQPFSNPLHYTSIAWFFFDLPIAFQCFLYGSDDFQTQFAKKNFRNIFLVAIAISFTIILSCFYEFNDPQGLYTAFGTNLMMSILFVYMLIRRDDVHGQSFYIALFKWIGTLFAFLSCFEFPVDVNTPLNISTVLTEFISAQSYPLTPLIKVLYSLTFCFDILYIVLVYRKCKEKSINPWARF